MVYSVHVLTDKGWFEWKQTTNPTYDLNLAFEAKGTFLSQEKDVCLDMTRVIGYTISWRNVPSE